MKVFSETNAAVPRVCQWYFDSKINSTLPEGATPYNKNDAPASDLTERQLRFEFRKFKYFVTEEVPQVRRETMCIELLEGIPNKEAEMIDLVKDGKWPFKNVTLDIVKKAFPNLTIN